MRNVGGKKSLEMKRSGRNKSLEIRRIETVLNERQRKEEG